jgi:hypothetical protein
MRSFAGALWALSHRENAAKEALQARLQRWQEEYSDYEPTGPVPGVISSDSTDWLILLAFFAVGVLLPTLWIALA